MCHKLSFCKRNFILRERDLKEHPGTTFNGQRDERLGKVGARSQSSRERLPAEHSWLHLAPLGHRNQSEMDAGTRLQSLRK